MSVNYESRGSQTSTSLATTKTLVCLNSMDATYHHMKVDGTTTNTSII
ncbi:hypothetical protein TOT_030000816 [Theileria orientalis strain Shintoku]|uniref:Uncharacterized protein n=1 Tax=Theileria orientalis strain Shintoku TaxID=869250 RepID=J4C8X6_THEOR|nr:hypothetical protein TOT_030000816 [Theileria orientalis strain Shintoku]BAM41553.1 hypothetical protein TOT_030000816 [Theileria orientalis strain Shintoku]|eukprot:XP_009691854.1 hypothetical protein TOT_030000816 [Theileria orientalis strain Shintoku]